MKNGLYKLAVLMFVCGVTLLSSCSEEPIFAAIEREIALRDASVEGFVTSIVATDNNIYAANGHIYRRTAGSGSWDSIATPSSTSRALELASDGTTLYALFLTEDGNGTAVYVLNETTGSWTAVSGVSGIQKIGSGNGRIYGFTGSASGAVTAHSTTGNTFGAALVADIDLIVASSGDYFATANAVYNSVGTALDLTGGPAGTIKAIVTDNDNDGNGDGNLYVIESGKVWLFNGTTWSTALDHNFGSPTDVSYLDADGKRLLLVSTEEGYYEVSLNVADGALLATLSPGTSAVSSMNVADESQYQNSLGELYLHTILAVTDPAVLPTNISYVVYASAFDTRSGGLWSYYANTDKAWNRE